MIAPRRKSVAEPTMLHKNVTVPPGQAGVLSQRFLKSYDKTANETVKKPYSSGYQLQQCSLFILCNYRRRYFNAFFFFLFSFIHFLYLFFIYIYIHIFLIFFVIFLPLSSFRSLSCLRLSLISFNEFNLVYFFPFVLERKIETPSCFPIKEERESLLI